MSRNKLLCTKGIINTILLVLCLFFLRTSSHDLVLTIVLTTKMVILTVVSFDPLFCVSGSRPGRTAVQNVSSKVESHRGKGDDSFSP